MTRKRPPSPERLTSIVGTIAGSLLVAELKINELTARLDRQQREIDRLTRRNLSRRPARKSNIEQITEQAEP